MERSAAVAHYEMKRPLRGLALVAYLAPMVGLLGTCAGLSRRVRATPPHRAYRDLTRSADELDLEMARAVRVMSDLAEVDCGTLT